MNLRTIKHWIFDLDGTLTAPQHDFGAIRETLHIPQDRLILEYIDEQPDTVAAQMHAQLQALELELAQQSIPAPKVREVLSALVAADCTIGILTRNSRHNALVSLTAVGCDDLIDEKWVLGRDNCAPKPDPEGLHFLLHAWQAPAARAVMVGDYLLDLQAGRAAGTQTIHIANNPPVSTLAPKNPRPPGHWPDLTDHRYETLAELWLALT